MTVCTIFAVNAIFTINTGIAFITLLAFQIRVVLDILFVQTYLPVTFTDLRGLQTVAEVKGYIQLICAAHGRSAAVYREVGRNTYCILGITFRGIPGYRYIAPLQYFHTGLLQLCHVHCVCVCPACGHTRNLARISISVTYRNSVLVSCPNVSCNSTLVIFQKIIPCNACQRRGYRTAAQCNRIRILCRCTQTDCHSIRSVFSYITANRCQGILPVST